MRDNKFIDPRHVLLPAALARALTGERRDELYDRIGSPTLTKPSLDWVFNFAENADGQIHEYRFWRVEVETPGKLLAKKQTIENVITAILPPSRKFFHGAEILEMFYLSRPLLQKLRPQMGGKLHHARASFFDRPPLVDFLKTRWLGSEKPIAKNN